MAVPAVNLTIDKGTYFEATFTVYNSDGSVVNLTGFAASARIRKHPTATAYQQFSTSVTAVRGEIRISLSNAATAALKEGRNYYDVIITENTSGRNTKVFEGTAIVTNTVSV